MYNVVSFLSSHPIIIASIVAILAIIGAFMPYIEKWIRPPEYIYLAWVTSMSAETPLLNYRRFEWKPNTNTMIIPIPQPTRLDVNPAGSGYSSLMLMIPKSWGSDAVMTIEGMEPANRHSSNDITLWVRHEELGERGDSISSEYLRTGKANSEAYTIQGIEWWNTAKWTPERRVQIAKPTHQTR